MSIELEDGSIVRAMFDITFYRLWTLGPERAIEFDLSCMQ
jgi:hypothetical protein